jgi:hypothetical protein
MHVRPNPWGEGWLVIPLTDQEAYELDRQQFGEVIALANLQTLQESSPLQVTMGGEG